MHSMIKKMVMVAMTVVTAMVFSASVWAAGGANDTVRMASDALIERLQAEQREIKTQPQRVEALVKTIVLPYFDDQALARRVLAKHWKAASPVQQQRFTEEFSAYLVRFYAKAFANYNGETVAYDDKVEIDERGIASVKTRIVRKSGAPIPVSYRLAQDSGQWKIIDVVIEGIGLVQSKRDEYSGVVNSKGLDGLIAELSAKNQQPAPSAP